jgi:hypothetical protein
MHPDKVRRSQLIQLTDLPNVGPACAADLRLLGIDCPQALIGRDGFALYKQLCDITQIRHDPCVLDVMLSITDFMAGNPPRAWWHYSAQRKHDFPNL